MHDLGAIGRGHPEPRRARHAGGAPRPSPTASIASRSGATRSGDPLRLPLAVTVEGDTMTLDFAGAPPQLPRGGLNVVLNYTAAYTRLSAEVHPAARTCAATPATTGRSSSTPRPAPSSTACGRPRSASGSAWLVHGANVVLNALADGGAGRRQGVHRPALRLLLVRQGAGRRELLGHDVLGRRRRRLLRAATASRGSSGRPRRPTPRSRCSRSASRAGAGEVATSPTPAAPGASAAGWARACASASSTMTA